MVHVIFIFIAAIFTQNIALTYLLGMCPFISLSRSLKTAVGMSFAVIFVVTLTAIVNKLIYDYILVPLESELIYYIVFIIVFSSVKRMTLSCDAASSMAPSFEISVGASIVARTLPLTCATS